MANITEETKNNLYFFIDDPERTEDYIIIPTDKPNSDMKVKLMPVWISKEAVELLQEAEASVKDKYNRRSKDDLQAKKMYEKHTKLVDELNKVRNRLNP